MIEVNWFLEDYVCLKQNKPNASSFYMYVCVYIYVCIYE